MVDNMQEVKLYDDNGPFQFLKIGESNNFSRNLILTVICTVTSSHPSESVKCP